jgi:hypothetical protein
MAVIAADRCRTHHRPEARARAARPRGCTVAPACSGGRSPMRCQPRPLGGPEAVGGSTLGNCFRLCCLRRRAAIPAAASQSCPVQGRKMFPRKHRFVWLHVRSGGFCGDLLRMTETDPLAVDCRSRWPSPPTTMLAIGILPDAIGRMGRCAL